MNSIEQLRAISPRDLAVLAVEDLAYISQTTVDGGDMYVIHAANGEALGLAPERGAALEWILAHDLIPASVH